MVFTYLLSGGSAHIIVVGPRGERENETRSILDSAGFQPLEIPPELHAEPQQLREELRQRGERIVKQREQARNGIERWSEEIRAPLERARRTLMLAEPFVRMETAARSSGQLAIVSGWMPKREIASVEQRLQLVGPRGHGEREPRQAEREGAAGDHDRNPSYTSRAVSRPRMASTARRTHTASRAICQWAASQAPALVPIARANPAAQSTVPAAST